MRKYKLNLNGKVADKESLKEYGFLTIEWSEEINDFDRRVTIIKEIANKISFLEKGDKVNVILFPILPIALIQYSLIKEFTGGYPQVWFYKWNKEFKEIEFMPSWNFENYMKDLSYFGLLMF